MSTTSTVIIDNGDLHNHPRGLRTLRTGPRCVCLPSRSDHPLPRFDRVLEIAPDFDVVVLAGDQLELASIVDRRAQSVVMRKYFERLRAMTRVVTCSGNHDLDVPHETGREDGQMARAEGPTDGITSDGELIHSTRP